MSTPNMEEIPLSDEDRVRMERLFEEAVSRFREMSLIMTRIGAFSPGSTADGTLNPLPNFEVTLKSGVASGEAATAGTGGETMMRRLCLLHEGGCGCYDWEKGVCEPCGPGDVPWNE